jgi:hypothetical protein
MAKTTRLLTPVSRALPFPTTHNLPKKHWQVREANRYKQYRFFPYPKKFK